jgi:hypothetical protein
LADDDDDTTSSIHQKMASGVSNDSAGDSRDSDEITDSEPENGSDGHQYSNVAPPDADSGDSDEVHDVSPCIAVLARFSQLIVFQEYLNIIAASEAGAQQQPQQQQQQQQQQSGTTDPPP